MRASSIFWLYNMPILCFISLLSGMSLSEVVFCGIGRDDVTLKLGLFLRYSAKVFSNWYLLFGCRKVIMASASKCLEFLLG